MSGVMNYDVPESKLSMPSHLRKFFQVVLLAGLLVSCDTPQKRAMRELAKLGIEPSGTALLDSVARQDTKRIGWLLDVGVYTEQRDPAGKTPLRVAIENRDIPSISKLLEAKVNVNAATDDRVSVLGVAVERGETAIVEQLLAAGARTDGLMSDGDKILPWAIRHGRLHFVRAMMKSGADPHLKDTAGNPLLHVAMECGRRDLTGSLIELGADPGATNGAGESTIEVAIRQGWLDEVPKLAAAGADPNRIGVDGKTLLDRAMESGNRELASLFLRIGANPNHRDPSSLTGTTLERAFSAKDLSFFTLFLEHGCKPPEGNWNTWLWKAYDMRNIQAARLLLSHGASALGPNHNSLFLAELAALQRTGDFLKLFLDYGSPAGTALYHAAENGDHEILSLLLSSGQPVNVTRVPTYDTPLGIALRNRHDRVAALLVESGANLRLALPEGQPPLHLAIALGCPRTVKALLDAGVDPNMPFNLPVSAGFIKLIKPGAMRSVLKYDKNFTPLMLAADSGVVASSKHLIKAGAKRNVWTRSYSMWPINFASRRGDVPMMRLILGRDPQREERHIEIRLSEQRARVFDAQGNELFSTKVSTGRKGFATPTGEFVITDKNRDWTSTIYHASMPYFQRLSCSDFGLHQGVVPGYPASHGCIRVPAGNAAKLFAMTEAGDRVRILP
jgi:ankyrin repeat protein